jgi:hypothetical protein
MLNGILIVSSFRTGSFGPEVVSWMMDSEESVNQSYTFLAINTANFL